MKLWRESKYILAAKKTALKVINLTLFPYYETIDELQIIEKLTFEDTLQMK